MVRQVTYQWQISAGDGDPDPVDFADIAGEVAATYTPVTGDVDSYLRCVVSGTSEVDVLDSTSDSTAVVIAA